VDQLKTAEKGIADAPSKYDAEAGQVDRAAGAATGRPASRRG